MYTHKTQSKQNKVDHLVKQNINILKTISRVTRLHNIIFSVQDKIKNYFMLKARKIWPIFKGSATPRQTEELFYRNSEASTILRLLQGKEQHTWNEKNSQ